MLDGGNQCERILLEKFEAHFKIVRIIGLTWTGIHATVWYFVQPKMSILAGACSCSAILHILYIIIWWGQFLSLRPDAIDIIVVLILSV